MKLTPEQHAVWLSHGKALSLYPIKVLRLADDLGVSRHSVRMAKAYTEQYGPPPEEVGQVALHLVVGDVHLGPDNYADGRMTILGKEMEELGREAIAKGQPFRVIFIGDTADLHSLSSYDTGKLRAEGQRLNLDLDALAAGLEQFYCEVSPEVWNYADVYWTEGNHEYRMHRYIEEHPELAGTLDLTKFFSAYGITTVPFMTWLQLDGVGYCHYMQGGAGRAISGINQARSLLVKGHRSVTVGHSHVLKQAIECDVYGNSIQTLVCGCFFDHDEEYALQSNSKWWRGLCVKRNVAGGEYDLETRNLASLRRKHKEA
jgi:hypothetical protein